ncbi:GDSL-type esterase/lipase family protein [Chitinophaga ginsengisegetis]|uniref:GDSL-type esterase/lipase family protein n=1 Tax=Chitinophaga ginsengisegetis TaxID=393003 RepID=UPI000DB9981F|nr:GDSL-type esterase/lipase family protein [Chitinophaga ginsengisegetis]MDR6568563.1 lysophospholipase L1-like esterase/pimeloyl-ACP methyl ester carboxylesterase [Chitinophaga ginsengisegetis]MDR6648206.1 lysophospholipase L1-like esterase/pimeloyl-ACP methyl ester carboxylesterase [Chitinophaga ginsengisegetis]MDR6654644.1 lysophospholipase L1-like esterase/pimeloyl-ACP methyl ester carboxylesterase [Chitinophaga ginsengisegetis]
MKSRYLIFLLILFYHVPLLAQRVKIACLGASICAGARLQHPETESYPAQLGKLLGPGFEVTNYGVSSTTLLKKGDHPYWNTPAYKAALASEPDIVLIDLGGNDSKLINRVHLDEYESDYHDMIRAFRALPSHPRILLLQPIVSFVKDTTQIWDPVITTQILPKVRQVAYDENLELVNLNALLIGKPGLMPDGIHPELTGTTLMAKTLFEVLHPVRDTAFNAISHLPGDKKITSFYGYRCADFEFSGRACKVVAPKFAAAGHPWIWRARFWGHEPQTDIALLERGYHVVYCDVAELFGNREAIQLWNGYYSLLRKAGLARKAVMEGMSRGAVYVYNWAAENPDKVAAVYVDNPVIDLCSWPGSQFKKQFTKRNEWEAFKKDYGFTSDSAAMMFKGSPLYKTKEIVKGRYPMLHVLADADTDVPPAENTLPFEEKIKALKGDITVMHKPGFAHHPHSFPDPTPIVDFILKAVK